MIALFAQVGIVAFEYLPIDKLVQTVLQTTSTQRQVDRIERLLTFVAKNVHKLINTCKNVDNSILHYLISRLEIMSESAANKKVSIPFSIYNLHLEPLYWTLLTILHLAIQILLNLFYFQKTKFNEKKKLQLTCADNRCRFSGRWTHPDIGHGTAPSGQTSENINKNF